MSKAKNRKIIYFVISLFAAAMVWWGTARGAGTGGDATIYMSSAENFAAGNGLGIFSADGTFRLIPYFAPFFPLFLSLFALLGLDLLVVAKILNLLLFGATIYLVLRTSDEYIEDWRYVIGLGLLLALSPVLNPVFSWAMSEPLSIFLGTFSIVLILKYFQSEKLKNLFYLSAILAGFTTLTRYGAIVYPAVVCLLLLFFEYGKWAKRLGQAVLYGVIAIIPVGIWSAIDILYTDTVSSRSVNDLSGLLPRITSFFGDLKSVLLFWFIPDSWINSPFYPQIINTVFVLFFVLVIIFAAWLLIKNTKKNRYQFIFSTMLLLFGILYILMTLVISLVTYPPITIGTRMFSPMYLMAFWLIFFMLYRFSVEIKNKRILNICVFLFMGLMVLWSGFRGMRIIQDNHQTGLGFQSISWQTSTLVDFVKELPADQILVTNEEMAVFALTERNAYPFAEVYIDQPLQNFSRYGDAENPSDGEKLFKTQSAYLVLFDSINSQFSGIYGDQADKRLEVLTNGLELVYQAEDGAVYLYPYSIEE